MARKRRRIVEGILYEWETPDAEHDIDDFILEELQQIPEMDVPRHEWSLRRCMRMEKMMRRGLEELYEALRDFEPAREFDA